MNPNPTPERTPDEYAVAVEAALRNVPPGEKPVIPAPSNPAEYMVLLNRALTELDKLSKMLPVDAADSRDLSKLSTEEKLALGEENSRKLADLAFKIAPIPTLERLDERLAEDTASRVAADAVLSSFRAPRPPA